MTIPGDVEKRWWVEVSGSNPTRVDELRPALLAFTAHERGERTNLQGCGFIIASGSDFAAVITAKHIFTEGVFRAQKPRSTFHPSALFVPKSQTLPSISPEKLKAFWLGDHHALALDICHLHYSETLDLACCVVVPQPSDVDPLKPTILPIDTTVPRVGDLVHMISLDNLTTTETASPTGESGVGRTTKVTRRVSIRIGVVTGIHSNGYRQYRWPCFTTSIPAIPGMSGGLVTLPCEGKTISACGIICADNSTDESHVDPTKCGESVIACAWPSLALRMPNTIPSDPATNTRTLHEFMRHGHMPMAIGGIDHIEIKEFENGDSQIRLR